MGNPFVVDQLPLVVPPQAERYIRLHKSTINAEGDTSGPVIPFPHVVDHIIVLSWGFSFVIN